MINRKKAPSIIETNILYLIIGLLLITVGAKLQSIELYSGLIVTEYILILLPILLYLRGRGYSIKRTLRLNRISLKQALYTVIIMVLLYPAAVFFNYIGIMLISKYGRVFPNPVPIPTSSSEFMLGLIIISITPGICEEVMFRGMLMNSYESLGRKKAIIYSAILFGLFHFNLQNLLGPIFLGIILGILLHKTNSIFTSIIGHMTNNLVALLLGTISLNFNELSNDTSLQVSDNMFLYGAITTGVWAAIFGYIAYKFIKSMPESIETDISKIDEYKTEDGDYEEIELYSQSPSRKRHMDILELLPLVVYIIIFCYFNYTYFFG